MVIVETFVRLALPLLLRGTAGAIAAAILPALAVLALVRAAPVTHRFASLMSFCRGRRMLALVDGVVTLLLLTAVVVVASDHARTSASESASAESQWQPVEGACELMP
jgi:hypothetical protein